MIEGAEFAQDRSRMQERKSVKNRMVVGIWLFVALLVPVNFTMAAEVQLHIPPLFQERPSWCWAAVGEMVFKYYDVPAAHQTDYSVESCNVETSAREYPIVWAVSSPRWMKLLW